MARKRQGNGRGNGQKSVRASVRANGRAADASGAAGAAGLQGPGLSAETPGPRSCDHPDCAAPGEYRAPAPRRSRSRHYLFCLDHVREYNKSWNFCAGMDEHEIEREIRLDTVWRRPTWPLGGGVAGAWLRMHTELGAGRFGPDPQPDGEPGQRRSRAGKRTGRPASPERRALGILDLGHPVTLTELKARYKELVKIHHPDRNGGDRLAEERLKEINHAYATLRRSLGA